MNWRVLCIYNSSLKHGQLPPPPKSNQRGPTSELDQTMKNSPSRASQHYLLLNPFPGQAKWTQTRKLGKPDELKSQRGKMMEFIA